jgi:uncharacterized protein
LFFYYTAEKQKDVTVRKKEMYDGAVPSGNSMMAYNLWQLSILLDNNKWKERALAMLSGLGRAVSRYPTSFGNWACLLQEISAGTDEIALVGDDFPAVQLSILAAYIPHRVFMASGKEDPAYPLLVGKRPNGRATIWLCRNYTCQNPVFSAKELMLLINRPQNG